MNKIKRLKSFPYAVDQKRRIVYKYIEEKDYFLLLTPWKKKEDRRKDKSKIFEKIQSESLEIKTIKFDSAPSNFFGNEKVLSKEYLIILFSSFKLNSK